jgi:hypothetical protein
MKGSEVFFSLHAISAQAGIQSVCLPAAIEKPGLFKSNGSFSSICLCSPLDSRLRGNDEAGHSSCAE